MNQGQRQEEEPQPLFLQQQGNINLAQTTL